jgi:hypothetical protein
MFSDRILRFKGPASLVSKLTEAHDSNVPEPDFESYDLNKNCVPKRM